VAGPRKVFIQGADRAIQESDQCGRAGAREVLIQGPDRAIQGLDPRGRATQSLDPRAGSCDPGIGSAVQGRADQAIQTWDLLAADLDIKWRSSCIASGCGRRRSGRAVSRQQGSKPANRQGNKEGRKEGRKREGCFTECLVAQQPMTLSLN
jgi:hypothetical protein